MTSTHKAGERNKKGCNSLDEPPLVRLLIEIVSANHLSRKSSKRSGKNFSDSTHDWIDESTNDILSTQSAKPKNANNIKSSRTKISPFCRVEYNNETIHQTSKIPNDNNPIWTIDTGSLFVFTTTLHEMFQENEGAGSFIPKPKKISFEVRNKKSTLIKVPGRSSLDLKNSESIGFVSISLPDILQKYSTEERFEFELHDEWTAHNNASSLLVHNQSKRRRSTLALRFRVASDSDIRFVKHIKAQIKENEETSNNFQNTILGKSPFQLIDDESESSNLNKVNLITEMDESEVAGSDVVDKMSSAAFSIQESMLNFREQVNSIAYSSKAGPSRRLAKPHPDPKNVKKTRFLTKKEIEYETFASPSHHWINAGSGKLGKIYLEVLACHDLPNMDVGEAIGNVTDSFVSAVYEDVLVQTPVIQDELSPRWLPWTQRAFIFHMMHPSSMLYLAVFDFDFGISRHEPIGRVAVNVGNLKKNITYTLKFDLFPSSSVTERKKNGSITVRLRIEIDDERAFLIAGLKPLPKMYVNVKKEKSFDVVRYTCFGEYGEEESFDLTILRSYINEILEYKTNISYSISDSFSSIIFWRGQVKVGSMILPLHSALFFVLGTIVIERPHLFPAMFFFSIAWIMLACMGSRLNHPSPWMKCNSFLHFFMVLLQGHSNQNFAESTINSMQNYREATDYDQAWKRRVESDWETAAKRAELDNKINNEIGNENIQTKITTGLEIELLAKLGRWQNIIGRICKKLRRIRIIMIWEDCFFSFWITATCLGLGIVSLILPMSLILQSIGRLVIWTFFGPWMKIVDIILTAKAKNTEQNRERMAKNIQKRSQIARVKREEAVKLQKMKVMKYGDFIIPVPAFNLARHYDRPLAHSTAKPISYYESISLSKEIKEIGLIPGQQLYGHMIPRSEKESEQNRKESEAYKKQLMNLLQEAEECGLVANGVDRNEYADILEVESEINFPVTELSNEMLENADIKSEGFEVIMNVDSERQDAILDYSRTYSTTFEETQSFRFEMDHEQTDTVKTDTTFESKSTIETVSTRQTLRKRSAHKYE